MVDPIEAEMSSGSIVKRDKFVGRTFQWMMGVPAIVFLLAAIVTFVGGAMATGAAATTGLVIGAGSLVLALMFLFGWATMPVIRTVVTDDVLHVQCGLWGPRIPLDRIEEVRLAQEPGRRSVGKRFEGDRWVTRFLMTGGDHVRVTYTTDKGKLRTICFTASDPAGVADAIQKARAGKVRIDTSSDDADRDAAAEHEMAAEEEQAAGRDEASAR